MYRPGALLHTVAPILTAQLKTLVEEIDQPSTSGVQLNVTSDEQMKNSEKPVDQFQSMTGDMDKMFNLVPISTRRTSEKPLEEENQSEREFKKKVLIEIINESELNVSYEENSELETVISTEEKTSNIQTPSNENIETMDSRTTITSVEITPIDISEKSEIESNIVIEDETLIIPNVENENVDLMIEDQTQITERNDAECKKSKTEDSKEITAVIHEESIIEVKKTAKQIAIETVTNLDLSNSTLTFEEFLDESNMAKLKVNKITNTEKNKDGSAESTDGTGEGTSDSHSKMTKDEIKNIIDKEIGKLTKSNTVQDLFREDMKMKSAGSDSEEDSDGSYERIEEQYYRFLDKSDDIKYKSFTEKGKGDGPSNCNSITNLQTKENIKKVLNSQPKDLFDDDKSYREIMEWDLQISDENVQILKAIDRTKPEKELKDELCEKLTQSKKEDKPEYEITPPKDIAEESDVIMYAKNTTESISCMQNKSIFTESNPEIKKGDIKPPQVYKMLKMSQNFPIFRRDREQTHENITEDDPEPENALIACKKIAEVREQLADFTKDLADFNERSRKARDAVIRDYNAAVEKEIEVVEKLMQMKEKMFVCEKKEVSEPRKSAYKCLDDIPDSVFKKHYEDMGMLLDEGSEEEEDFLKYAETNDEDEKEVDEKEYLTTNEDDSHISNEDKDQGKYDEDGGESDKNVNNEKKYEPLNDSNEDYFSTNEDELEEYFKSVSVQEEESDSSQYESKYYDYKDMVEKLFEDVSDGEIPDDRVEDCTEGDEIKNISELNDGNMNDNKVDTDEVAGDVEFSFKRNVTCSLEMQLAKETM